MQPPCRAQQADFQRISSAGFVRNQVGTVRKRTAHSLGARDALLHGSRHEVRLPPRSKSTSRQIARRAYVALLLRGFGVGSCRLASGLLLGEK